jgi:hypothetical protein
MELKVAGRRLGFGECHEVEGRLTVADLVPTSRRCGLYLLGFRTGEAYAGLSTDVVGRFVQHARTHADISSFATRYVPRTRLDAEETLAIERLEKWGFRLRNIAKASAPSLESNWDAVLSRQQQDQFVYKGVCSSHQRPPQLRDLRRLYLRRFGELMARPVGLDAVAGFAAYLPRTIPDAPATQAAFWAATAAVNSRVHLRVNIQWQEVLTAYSWKGDLRFSLHVARSPLESAFGSSLRSIRHSLTPCVVSDHRYSPGGVDQVKLDVAGYDGIGALLRVPSVRAAARLFNVRLMRKGPCVWARNHCPQLADLGSRWVPRGAV